jgi:hypothetical protein
MWNDVEDDDDGAARISRITQKITHSSECMNELYVPYKNENCVKHFSCHKFT